jgi:hypothetical protein
MSFSQIKRKAEDAVVQIIENSASEDFTLADVQIVAGTDPTIRKTPRIEVVSPRAVPEIESDLITGNWTVTLSVAYIVSYKDHVRAAKTKVESAIFDILMDADLPGRINSEIGPTLEFFVYGGAEGVGLGYTPLSVDTEIDDEAKELREVFECELYCRPSITQETGNDETGFDL